MRSVEVVAVTVRAPHALSVELNPKRRDTCGGLAA